MRTFASALVLWAGVCGVAFSDEPSDVPKLIDRLGSGSYAERQEAYRGLDNLGEPALESLRRAMTSADSETRHRASELVKRISERQAAAKLFAPTMVEINFVDKPIQDAIREFGRVTNLPISPVGDVSKLGNRKVTYRSGKVTVWDALAGFTSAANISEWDGLTSLPGVQSPFNTPTDDTTRVLGNGRVFISRSSYRAPENPQMKSLMVYDSSPSPSPTCITGSVRVRALPVGTPLPNLIVDPSEIVVPLQISLEPRVNWHTPPSGNPRPPAVKYCMATDERGQKLGAIVTSNAPAPGYDEDMMMMINRFGPSEAPRTPQRSQFLALRIRRGGEPSKSLVDVAGALTLPLCMAGELAVIDNPLAAAERTVQGRHSSLSVKKAEKLSDGAIKIELSYEMKSDAQLAQTLPRLSSMKSNMQFQGNVLIQEYSSSQLISPSGQPTEYMGLSLADDQSRKYTVATVANFWHSSASDGESKFKSVITFKPAKDAGPPTRLVLSGIHPVAVELPFSFKNVQLP